jgi:DNA-directed RNA polymerase subunit L
MEIKILEQSKTKLTIEIVGEDHTLCNALKEELNKDKGVKIASYKIEHPLTANPIMLIEADDAKKSLESAVKKIVKFYDELSAAFKSIK